MQLEPFYCKGRLVTIGSEPGQQLEGAHAVVVQAEETPTDQPVEETHTDQPLGGTPTDQPVEREDERTWLWMCVEVGSLTTEYSPTTMLSMSYHMVVSALSHSWIVGVLPQSLLDPRGKGAKFNEPCLGPAANTVSSITTDNQLYDKTHEEAKAPFADQIIGGAA